MNAKNFFGTITLLAAIAVPASASSHREAPAIAGDPRHDATDFYMFRSYEEGRGDFVTLIANYNPLQDAYGGPNYFSLSGRYDIVIENDGDPDADLRFVFNVNQFANNFALPVGGKTVPIPLQTVAPNTPTTVELYTVTLIDDQGNLQAGVNPADGSTVFAKPFDNAGRKTFPNYAAYANRRIYDIDFPGCEGGRVFVGQRKESFAVNLGEIFDLINLNPLGARDANPSSTEYKNVTSLELELPIDCLTRGRGNTIGGWTASFSDGAQVSRLGMPLVNELVIGLPDKNLFNRSLPKDDLSNFAEYVTNPTLPELLQILFGVEAPNNFPRTDLVATFVTGIPGVNELGLGEMQRLNVTIPPVGREQQNNLGVVGGDNAGFPNGRRPGDDVVDIELRVAMGLLCHAFPGTFCDPADAPSGLLPYTDGTLQDASQFDAAFPYLRTPLAGSPNGLNGIQ